MTGSEGRIDATVIKLDAAKLEQLQEEIRRVNNLLRDLDELLSRYSQADFNKGNRAQCLVSEFAIWAQSNRISDESLRVARRLRVRLLILQNSIF